MSKQASTKQAQKGKSSQMPQCKNKKQAKLVCLNPNCSQHAFFCTNCQNDQCQVAHHHGDKLLSVSFKQYVKRVLKQKIVEDELEQALNRYAQCLQKLKRDVEQFVEKQMQQLQQIKRKAQQLGEQQQKVIQKLRKKEYTQLTGSDLDKLWQKIVQIQKRDNKDTIQFLSIKEQQIKQISDNFQKVNKMELQDYGDDENENSQASKNNESKVSKISKESVPNSGTNTNMKKQSNSGSSVAKNGGSSSTAKKR